MSVRGIRLRYFALVLGLIAFVAGIYLAFFQGRDYVKSEATIVSIVEEPSSSNDDPEFTVMVRYTVDGKEYTERLDSYSSSYKVGKTVKIKYNPENPSEMVGDGLLGPIYMIVVGAAIIAVVIFTWVREKKNQKSLEQSHDVENNVVYAPSVPGPERQLYFLTDVGTPKYGHRIEDRSRRVLYEAKMTKFTMLRPFGFDFIDHEHNTTTPHLIGHEESSEWDSLLLDNHYTFTFDGEFIWKHLKRNGITVESTFRKGATLLGHSFRVFRDGNLIATVEASSQYVHEEDAEAHQTLSKIPAKGFYRIRTTETTLDLLFTTILAFARTEATSDNGGNRRTLFNSMKGE